MATAHFKCSNCKNPTKVVGRNRKDADRYAAYCENRGDVCQDCKESALKVQRQAQNEASAKANLEAGLPELRGTPKQIAWAETIRAGALAHPNNTGLLTPELEVEFTQELVKALAKERLGHIANVSDEFVSANGRKPNFKELVDAVVAANRANVDLAIAAIRDEMLASRLELQRQDSAKWWIDLRGWHDDYIPKRLNEQAAKWSAIIVAGIAQ